MKTMTCALTVLVAGTFALSGLAGGNPPAQSKKADVQKPLYDEKADARADIKAALRVARRDNRRVLIQWGRNGCGLCVQVDKLFRTNPDLKKVLLYEYVLVHVDVGPQGERNTDVYREYKMPLSVPSLTVHDADGKFLAGEAVGNYDAKKLLEFLTAHRAEPLKAEAVLNAALAEAARTNRDVFLHFGAPWCGWCRKLEAWLDQPTVAEILGKDFVEVNIDLDRMTGAKEVFDRYNAKGNGGIPWFVFLDSKGKAVATSDGPKGNIGFPYYPHEIDHFVTMLQAAKHRITADEVDALRRSLTPPVKGADAAK